MKFSRRALAALAGGVVTAVAVATPAMASTITTSISNWSLTDTSGHWGDTNTSWNTTIRMDNCWISGTDRVGTFSYATITLWRQRGIYPDETKGDRNLYCTSSDVRSWPSLESDTYYFELLSTVNTKGGFTYGRFNANPVVIGY